MRVVFMGTPDYAVVILKALIESENEVISVFTRKDAPKNRKMKLFPPPVKICAEEYGIPVYQPVSLKNDKWKRILNDLSPDIIIVAAYGKILPPDILSLPKFGCINVHASLLPKYRGASPINAAILHGDNETGVTIMQMNEGLDTGDILMRESIKIAPDECFDSLHDRLAILGSQMIVKAVSKIENSDIYPEKQDDSASSYAPLIKNEDALIDFSKDAASVSQLIRAFDPLPGAFCFLDGKKIKLFRASLTDTSGINDAGRIIKADKSGLLIGCKTGKILIKELQESGGKRMSVSAYTAGHRDLLNKCFSSFSGE